MERTTSTPAVNSDGTRRLKTAAELIQSARDFDRAARRTGDDYYRTLARRARRMAKDRAV